MQTLFVGSCAKESDKTEANEDAYAFSADRLRFVLSDGASESYDSRLWANLLVSKFASHAGLDLAWLRDAIADYHQHHDFSSMSWSQQHAFERGCFATLLAVEHSPECHRLTMIGIGDTVAVLIVGTEIVRAWPLDHPDLFKQRPMLLSTHRAHNVFIEEHGFFDRSTKVLDLTMFPDATLLCMTDALGEWTLRMAGEAPERLAELAAIRSVEELWQLVTAERASKRMRVDDSTLAIMKFAPGESSGGVSQP